MKKVPAFTKQTRSGWSNICQARQVSPPITLHGFQNRMQYWFHEDEGLFTKAFF